MKTWTCVSTIALACAALAGCAKPAPPSQNLQIASAGFDAFKADDPAKLEQQIQILTAQLPADLTTGVVVDCSPQGYALRSIVKVKKQLEYLDQPTVLSMGDPGRYVYFQQLINDGGEAGEQTAVQGPTDFECERMPGYTESQALSTQEFEAVRDAGRNRMRAWYGELKQSLGSQFEPQMQAVAKTLHDNRLRRADRWEAPNSIG
jgi:hypothetical protein